MKKLISIILSLCIVVATGCIMTGCGNDEVLNRLDGLQTELQAQSGKINDLQTELQAQSGKIDDLQSQIKEMDDKLLKVDEQLCECNERINQLEKELYSYNEAGGFYEREVNNMVDCSLFLYDEVRSSPGDPIFLNNKNEGSVFTCTVDSGILSILSGGSWQHDKKIFLKNGEGFWWITNERLSKAMIDIVLKVDGNIAGYAVVEIYSLDEVCRYYQARTLKSALILQSEGAVRHVTQEQVQAAIDEVKKI